MTMSKLNFEEAYQELQHILKDLEQMDLPLDQLAEKARRATELIQYGQTKLRTIEDDLEGLFSQLED